MEKYFLGIDIGTYASKGMLIDESLRPIAEYSVDHDVSTPHPGWFEHDADEIWWGDFCKISQNIIKKAGISADSISAVGPSALGTDCLAVDEKCRPLRPAILYGIDSRASLEMEWLTDYYGERVESLFGHPINSGDTATKILWIKNNEPEVYNQTYKFLTGSSFLVAKLTDIYIIDKALATGSFRPLYNQDGSINEKECSLYCKPEQICDCAISTDIAGYITDQAATETGLKVGTPVICGTGDSTAEAISVGLVDPGTFFFQLGSSMYYYYCLEKMINDYKSPNGNGSLKGGKVFTVPNTFCLGDGTNAAGALTRWIRDTFYQSEMENQLHGGENAYAIMAKEAAEVEVGSDGLFILPYIYGERSPIQDPLATGMIFGIKGSHTRKHFNRAALEAVGYSVYQHLILLNELGEVPEKIIMAGGGIKNSVWTQIVCDILGREVVIPNDYQCSSYGDALMAAIGVGHIKDFHAMKKSLPKGNVLFPDEKNHRYYKEGYDTYIALYQNNKDLMHKWNAQK